MNKNEKVYYDAIEKVYNEGMYRDDRTGVGTRALFGTHMEFDLQDSFPVLNGKSVYFKGVMHELLWFLKGETNIKYLKDNGIRIWDEWADEDGEVGKLYGYQWRNWENRDKNGQIEFIDQLSNVVTALKENPMSRRHIITAWNPSHATQQNLPPCHILYQFYVTTDGHLDCQMYQRSADMFLGVPFDIASYAALTHLVANQVGLTPRNLKITLGDTHVYENHITQVEEYLKRDIPSTKAKLYMGEGATIDNAMFADFKLTNYIPLSTIKATVAV
tara:strand:- start:4798 stop:5619 length:822 start_codon:yes stop_codon:yes gene_type:complete